MEKPKVEIPGHLSLIVIFSSGLTLVLSTIYTVLSILGIIYRYQCYEDTDVTGSAIFINTLHRVYILQDECDYSLSKDGLTEPNTVFLMMIITSVVSLLCVIVASLLIAVLRDERVSRYLNSVAYVYVGACLASFVVDLTLATHFGMDYSTLTRAMDEDPTIGDSDMFMLDTMRLGALLLMSISLKGYVAHAINIVFLVLLIVHVLEFQRLQQKNRHPIHKLGALNAYEARRKPEDPWPPQPEMFLPSPSSRGQQINPAFINDDDSPRSPYREQATPEYTNNRLYDRSESWQPGPTSGARPFSYLEEARRPVPVRPPTSPSDPQWRRDWPPPAVPAPDYSPQNPRRLKSALKPSY